MGGRRNVRSTFGQFYLQERPMSAFSGGLHRHHEPSDPLLRVVLLFTASNPSPLSLSLSRARPISAVERDNEDRNETSKNELNASSYHGLGRSYSSLKLGKVNWVAGQRRERSASRPSVRSNETINDAAAAAVNDDDDDDDCRIKDLCSFELNNTGDDNERYR